MSNRNSSLAFAVGSTAKHEPPTQFVDILFSGFPDNTAPIFIEVENEKRESVNFGEWLERDDGHCVLRIKLKQGN